VSGAPVSWIVTNWRLKLLSLVLAVGLLGGVAFSENPPTFDTVTVRVEYHNLPPGLVVVNRPTSVDVPVAGFRDDVQRYRQTSAGVAIDLSGARPGVNQVYLARPREDVSGLTFRQSAIPVSLTIEPLMTRQLEIEVRTPNRAPGIVTDTDKTYATCGNANDRCQVSVTGPASVVNNLQAYVDYDVQITSAATGSSPNQPIRFDENGHPVDLSKTPQTDPPILWTPDAVTVLVTTEGGTQSKTVPLSVPVLGSQPCGYQITGVDVQPDQVTVSGPVDAVSRITAASVSPIVLSGLTATERVQRTVLTGFASVSADPPQVSVGVGVSQAFSCAAPTPTPTPTPRPSP
jgi:YbbR domain-containing protein